jgi:hypothetical protein
VNKILKETFKLLKSDRGNSLLEFAVVSALMATLAATATPKLSLLSELAKGEKSKNEIDKILTQARTFYQSTQDSEGRGRFPGQEKFNRPVGNYGLTSSTLANAKAAQDQVVSDLENFTNFESNLGAKWRSVFGISNLTAPLPGLNPDTGERGPTLIQNDTQDTNGPIIQGSLPGHEEWIELFGGSTLASSYQDGHFIYVVIPGGGSGDFSFSPVLFVADLENPSDFNSVLEP